MNLTNKNALIFAATGAIASEVARTLAQNGATVWLSGRNTAALARVAYEIIAAGGSAHYDVVDATDSDAVHSYVARVVEKAGTVDVVFNGIGGRPAALGYPAPSTTQEFAAFLLPLQTILGSTFLTSRAAAVPMMRQGNGTIITLSATLTGMAAGYMAGISATCGGIEALTRSLAGEFGASGVRVNCVRGSAMPETRTIQETGAGIARLLGHSAGMSESPSSDTPLRRPITVRETANTVAFLASDAASGITGQVVTVCAGAFVG